jgi:hypothetical protein
MSATRRTGRHHTRNIKLATTTLANEVPPRAQAAGHPDALNTGRAPQVPDRRTHAREQPLPSLGPDIPTRSIRTCSQRVEGSSRPPSRICVGDHIDLRKTWCGLAEGLWRPRVERVRFSAGAPREPSRNGTDQAANISLSSFAAEPSFIVVPSCTDRRPTSWSTCGTTICRRAPSAASRINRRREIIGGVRRRLSAARLERSRSLLTLAAHLGPRSNRGPEMAHASATKAKRKSTERRSAILNARDG